jgi:hypothetical protein
VLPKASAFFFIVCWEQSIGHAGFVLYRAYADHFSIRVVLVVLGRGLYDVAALLLLRGFM